MSLERTTTMTVAELIEQLQNFDDETPVVFAYQYGDYRKTTVCAGIDSVGLEDIEWSDYHRMYREQSEDTDNETEEAVVIG